MGARPGDSQDARDGGSAGERGQRLGVLRPFYFVRRWLIKRFRHPLGWIDERVLARTARSILEDERRSGHELDADHLMYALAATYNIDVIGPDWARQVFSPGETSIPKSLRKARQFARAESLRRVDDNYRHQARVLRIAEAVFNLRQVDGIQGQLKALRAGRVESTVAELEAGSFLARRGIAFQYVTAVGVRGRDYDIVISTEDGGSVPCEVECRIEGGALTASAIRSTLGHARKQLPKGEQGIVFVKVPEEWVLTPDSAPVISTAVADALRNTTRVAAVVVRWEETYLGVPAGGAVVTKYRVVVNEGLTIVAPLQSLIARLRASPTGGWVSFGTIARTAVDGTHS